MVTRFCKLILDSKRVEDREGKGKVKVHFQVIDEQLAASREAVKVFEIKARAAKISFMG